MQSFRHWFKMSKPGTLGDNWDSDFMGYIHEDKMGFFAMYHGHKEDIYGFLRKETEMAEDGQAIYEFVQNAADSNSSHFYMFYNEKYFLVINNGDTFTNDGVKSILNVGQSHGKDDDPDKIGRFGIGFKLVHRLVGKSNGLKELTEDYAGPQMFSWTDKQDFIDFTTTHTFEPSDVTSSSPWLMKILLTNFPASIDENVKDTNYQSRIPYPREEFLEFQNFVKANIDKVDVNTMTQGTMFFIKLGEGKIDLLNKDREDINSRIENTLYFLKNLTHLQVNSKIISRNKKVVVEDRIIIETHESDFVEIGLDEKRDKRFPIVFQMGYVPYSFNDELIRKYPNFYKFFPMEDTTYGLQFIIHCNVFSIGSNRRHLHEGTINRNLLHLLTRRVTEQIDTYCTEENERVYDIFANFVLSDYSNTFIDDCFLKPVIKHLAKRIPTDTGGFVNKELVVIKNTEIECNPSDFGINKSWYKWYAINENHKELIIQSKDNSKLGLSTYTLKRLLEEGRIESINKWISTQNEDELIAFLFELNNDIPANINDIEFIKLENGSFSSINSLSDKTIIRFPKLTDIYGVIRKLGFTLSNTDYEQYPTIKAKIAANAPYLKEDAEAKLFHNKLQEVLPGSSLSANEKKRLFLTLQTFKEIGEKTLADKLILFCNNNGEMKPLSKLINPQTGTLESWLKPYMIKPEEFFEEISGGEYLRNEKSVYNDIIVPEWETITTNLSVIQIEEFYRSVVKYFSRTENPLSIKSKPIVYCNDKGWVNINTSLFYHSQLSTFQHLTGLVEVIETNTLKTPDKKVLVFFESEPFKLNDSSVEVLLNSVELSVDASRALIEFSKGKVNVFDYGNFTSNGNKLNFKTDRTTKQYYSSKDEVVDYVSKYCTGKLVVLPDVLVEFKDLVLKGQELYRSIIDYSIQEWNKNDGILTELLLLLANSGLTEVVKSFVNSQSSINLSVDDINEKDLTFSWMLVINGVFETHELSQVKKKVLIDGIKLSELTWNNTVILENNESIKLGSVLSRFSDVEVVSEIKENLHRYNRFDNHKINALFHSDEAPNEQELLNIANEMLKAEDNKLKNLDQLLLVLYLNKQGLLLNIEPVLVQAANNEWFTLKDNWYLKKFVFIDDNAVLNERYNGISKKRGKEYSLDSRPYFSSNKNQFHCYHLKETLSDDELICFLEYIYEEVTKNAQSNVNWLDNYHQEIGFRPKYTVFAESNYVYNEELLPEVVVQWGKLSDNNEKLLSIIGVHTSSTAIVKLRKYLLGYNPEYQFEGFSRSNESDLFLLRNTIRLLADNEVIICEDNSSAIRSITDYLGAVYDISEILLPVGIGIENGSIISQFITSENALSINSAVAHNYKAFEAGSFLEFIRSLIDLGVHVVDADNISENWQKKYTSLLEFKEPQVDIDTLESESFACDFPAYLNWKEISESEISIQLINGPIPYYVPILGVEDLAVSFTKGEYFYDSSAKVLYSNPDKIIEAIIKELSSLLDEDDLSLLLGGSVSSILPVSREQELLKQIEELREQLNRISPDNELERGGLPGEAQKDWNLEARKLLREHLESLEEFDCSLWDDSNVPSSIVRGVLYKDKPCVWVVRSAMSQDSKFHLTPYEWSILGDKNVFLALRTNHDTIKVYGIIEDIKQVLFDSNHTINLNFKSVMISVDFIDALSKMMVYYEIWGSGLVFKNPTYSAGVLLKDIDKCKVGIINKLSDEAL